ncbi:arabinan endo-1,5-alpha-L-arabinosidase [Caldilinea sp.]|nr:arabinan endo-1,5-alpha-L-arabinosidase [Caldilinea sp.]GIV70922.1 MAG: extracellular endo-alpha-(1->5)-L-arabinanase 1 [Caldilinea sp.]
MKRGLLVIVLLSLLAACRPIMAPSLSESPSPEPMTLEPTGFIQRIHDPVMAKEGDTYYVFSTGARIIVICSKDMLAWEFCGRVFDRLPAWLTQAIPNIGDLWAPDISFYNDRWQLYYAGSTFGSPRSVIGLATNATLDANSPDYAWVDEGLVIESTGAENWNAIDPNFALDAEGNPWLAFGSYWSGLKLVRLDPATRKPSSAEPTIYAIAQRPANGPGGTAIEAPFIIHRNGYYYLFASFDQCCQGASSTYNVRVGRAESITGPYLDREGVPMLEGGGTTILTAYDRWRGPGHNGVYREGDVDWFVYHAYDARQGGVPKLRIESLGWDEEGWPYLPSQKENH